MNTITAFLDFPIMSPLVPVGWLLMLADPGCPPPSGPTGRSPAERAVCGVADWATVVSGLPARVWQTAVSGWPWLLAVAVVVLAGAVAVRLAHRAAWRRAVAGGYWARVVPPWQVDPGHAEAGWRLLAGLARMARQGWWRPAKPPLAFEIYHDSSGRLTVGLWLPGWVPYPQVVDEAARVWPGARLDHVDPPSLTPPHDGGDGDGRWWVAGVRLAAARPDTGFLVDDTRTAATAARSTAGGDRLHAVFAALGKPDGPALLQVLVRPAPRSRLTALNRAARHTARPRRTPSAVVSGAVVALLLGTLRFVLDLITELASTGRPAASHTRPSHPAAGGSGQADPVHARAMREAAEKLAGGPHLLATVRVGVARPGLGSARVAARSIGYGFRTVARHLYPVRLSRAQVRLDRRRAGRGEWLLLSTAELAVLAHLPADPARHGFEVTAVHRSPPVGASHVDPEAATRGSAGWTRTGWHVQAGSDTDGDPGDHHTSPGHSTGHDSAGNDSAGHGSAGHDHEPPPPREIV